MDIGALEPWTSQDMDMKVLLPFIHSEMMGFPSKLSSSSHHQWKPGKRGEGIALCVCCIFSYFLFFFADGGAWKGVRL